MKSLKYIRLIVLFFALGSFAFQHPVQAADFDPVKDVPVELVAASDGLPVGQSVALAVVFHVPSGYHINSLEGGLFYVEFDSLPGLTFTPAVFPQGKDFQGEEVFSRDVLVRSSVQAATNVSPGPKTLKVRVGYQICTETGVFQCFFPVDREVSLDLPVIPAEVVPKPQHETIFGASSKKSPSTTEIPEPTNVQVSPAQPANEGLVGSLENALARGSFMALFLVFIGGILSSFTPCVYPIIPITISYIGARAEGQKLRGFFLSLFFVLGLAVMYSSLGVMAALTGGVFGGLTQNPIVYAILIVIFIVMGISMMGAFDLQLPAAWQGKLQSGQRKGAVGAIFMGMAAGLIAAPCVGPILVALLTWVAKTGSVIVGFGLLFSYSAGMGMLFIVIGTFAGAITALPKAGAWMENIKHFFGWLLWGTALFFAQYVLPVSWMPLLWGAFLILLGTYVGAFKPFAEHEWRWVIAKWIGLMAVIGGIFFLLLGLSRITDWPALTTSPGTVGAAAQEKAPNWIVNDEQGAFAQAQAEGKPLLMDFYADWCAACVELDHRTYNQPEILSRAEHFICLKMDFTKQDDWSKEMTRKYQVKGMPTVIFFGTEGQEAERFVGFKDAHGVAEVMDRVQPSRGE